MKHSLLKFLLLCSIVIGAVIGLSFVIDHANQLTMEQSGD